ncbi:pilus assembly protein PilE [Stenotrophomonas daejeonensis]|uniref:Pilus assembly protein PilE n=1 Tax=Stenotrophomonas daejeonensis TaxID=659018 RepID=A0A0R0E1N3_9GAMM|nr:type IV pilin protein [Stenotrophomonas daejeonensis]KRG88124.1 pilus assembly protein PilE [Stenotrophomonas daejeonensis]
MRSINHMQRKGGQAGFTLIEIMIVVVIIAVLASIAYPSYQRHVIKSRRAAVEACLQQHAQLMERHYTTNLTYVGAAAPSCEANLTKFYAVGFDGAVAARSYTIRAVPTSSQPDSSCGTLTLNAQGVRTKSGSGTVAECW